MTPSKELDAPNSNFAPPLTAADGTDGLKPVEAKELFVPKESAPLAVLDLFAVEELESKLRVDAGVFFSVLPNDAPNAPKVGTSDDDLGDAGGAPKDSGVFFS